MKRQNEQVGRGFGRLLAGLLATTVLAMGSIAHAATITWDNGGDGTSWGTVAGGTNNNWSGTPDNTTPAAGDDVVIGASATTVNYNTAIYPDGSDLRTVSHTAGTLNISANMDIETTDNTTLNAHSADVNHSSGIVDVTAAFNFRIGTAISGGTYDLSGGTLQGLGRVVLTGTGVLDVSGGTLSHSGDGAAINFGAGSPVLNYTAGSINYTGGADLFGGQFNYAAPGGGLDVTATENFNVGNSSGTADMTLSVLGASTVNTLSLGTDDLIFNSDGVYAATINAASDQFLSVTGDINLGGLLTVSDLSGAPNGTTWDILSGTTINGDFTSFNLPDYIQVLDNGNVDGTYTLGVVLPPVPEPTTLALFGLGTAVLFLCGRRRRKR